MKLRVNIEFIGLDKVKITKFSGSKTIKISDLLGDMVFDFVTFKVMGFGMSDFCLSISDGDGSLEEPWELSIYKKDYDRGYPVCIDLMHAKDKRSLVIERTVMP